MSGVIFGATPPGNLRYLRGRCAENRVCEAFHICFNLTGQRHRLFHGIAALLRVCPVARLSVCFYLQPQAAFLRTPSLHPVGSPIRSVPIDVSGTSFKISLGADAALFLITGSEEVDRVRHRTTGFLYSQSAYTIAASPLFISLAPRP